MDMRRILGTIGLLPLALKGYLSSLFNVNEAGTRFATSDVLQDTGRPYRANPVNPGHSGAGGT